MTLTTLEDLRNRGILNDLYSAGIITPKAFLMLEAALKVRDLTRQGVKNGQAVRMTAELLRCTPKTVYKYLSRFEKEYPWQKKMN